MCSIGRKNTTLLKCINYLSILKIFIICFFPSTFCLLRVYLNLNVTIEFCDTQDLFLSKRLYVGKYTSVIKFPWKMDLLQAIIKF